MPLVWKGRSSVCAAATEPVPETLATILPRVADVVAAWVAAPLRLLLISNAAPIMTTISAMPPPIQRPRLMPSRRGSVVVAIILLPYLYCSPIKSDHQFSVLEPAGHQE